MVAGVVGGPASSLGSDYHRRAAQRAAGQPAGEQPTPSRRTVDPVTGADLAGAVEHGGRPQSSQRGPPVLLVDDRLPLAGGEITVVAAQPGHGRPGYGGAHRPGPPASAAPGGGYAGGVELGGDGREGVA